MNIYEIWHKFIAKPKKYIYIYKHVLYMRLTTPQAQIDLLPRMYLCTKHQECNLNASQI
jgi:hypothetical protein